MAENTGKAVFLPRPRRIEDLRDVLGTAHPSQRIPYVIEATLELDWIDYENFIADMLADRWFLEEYGKRCFVDRQEGIEIYHCLLVSAKGRSAGVPVLPNGDHVARAALYPAGE